MEGKSDSILMGDLLIWWIMTSLHFAVDNPLYIFHLMYFSTLLVLKLVIYRQSFFSQGVVTEELRLLS